MLDSIPGPGDRRVAVRVTPDALRHLRARHPWVYEASITDISHEGSPGDLAVVFDDKRRFAAIGLWDPRSPIRLRVLQHRSPATIDDRFWAARFAAADELRAPLADDPGVTGLRLIHGENDRLPALVIDRYAEVLVIKLYSEAWFPHLRTIVDTAVRHWAPETIVLRLARNVAARAPEGIGDGVVLFGPSPGATVPYLENGHTMTADPVQGQKTGAFLDQRANRRLVGERAEGADVLDVFCCHGGFSVHAAAGGAASVHAVDLSPHAVAAAERHLAVNTPTVPRRATVGDAFEVMAELAGAGERYDLVVVDPPSFASRADQVHGAIRSYQRLTHLALALIRPGGTLVQASCSSRIERDAFVDTIHTAARLEGLHLVDELETGHDIDHPIGFPQGGYLKALFATVRH